MAPKNQKQNQGPYVPCQPEEFAGRSEEKKKLFEILDKASDAGQMVMISGASGSGKSSFLKWAESEIQNRGNLALKKAFCETPGMIYITYRDLLTDLKGYQKIGWFKKILDNDKVKTSITEALEIFEKALPYTGPLAAVVRIFLPKQPIEHYQLLKSYRSVLRNLSEELTANNRILAINIDDTQWSSDPDFKLLKDLIRNLPRAIIFIIAFQPDDENKKKYDDLRELDKLKTNEIQLGGMSYAEIADLANKRYGLSIDDLTAEFLSTNIGDPFCLVACFELLQERNLSPSLAHVQEMKHEAINPAHSIYLKLNQTWKNWVNSLCILRPPLRLTLIACMLGVKELDIMELQDELNQSIVFRKLKKEQYDFAFGSLREYCKKELPENLKIKLHSKAAKCIETLKEMRLFSWDNIPGNDNGRFIEFLMQKFGIDWVKTAKIEKIDDGKTIRLTDENNFLSLKLNNEKTKVNLEINDGRTYEFFMKIEDDKLNIYKEIPLEQSVALSEHLFAGRKYKKALELNLKLGEQLYNLFEYTTALQMTERAKICAEELTENPMLATAFHQKGMIFQAIFRFSDSLDSYNQSLKIKQEIGDRAGEAITLHHIGTVYQMTNRFGQALDSYDQSLKIKQEIGDKAGESITLHHIGMVYQMTNRFEQALDFYNKSLKIKQEIGDKAGESITLHHIGTIYQKTNRFKEALDFYKQALKIEREIGDRAGEARALHHIGMVYQMTNRFKQASDFYNKSLEINRDIGDRAGEARLLHHIGVVNQKTNRFEDALNFYNRGLEIGREVGDPIIEAINLHQIGRVYQKTNRFEDALNFYNQSLKIERELKIPAEEAVTLHQIGRIYEATNRFDLAYDFYNKSLKAKRELLEASTYGSLSGF